MQILILYFNDRFCAEKRLGIGTMRFLVLCVVLFTATSIASTDSEQACQDFVSIQDNYKLAHENDDCLKAANEGFGSAQYSVGMAFGFAGNRQLEEEYYRLAADNRIIAAYLALGHHMRDESIWESIYWYQRFVQTKTNGYGYAANLLSRLFETLDDEGQAQYWLEVCVTSDYHACGE